MQKISITEASKIVEVSRDKIRYAVKILGIEYIKEGRVSYIPKDATSILKAMYQNVKNGMSPREAAKNVLSVHAIPTHKQKELVETNVNNDKRFESMERAIMLLVESNKRLSNENKLIMNKLNQLTAKVLPVTPSQKVEVWKYKAPKKKHVPLLKRIWLEIFNPISLRSSAP